MVTEEKSVSKRQYKLMLMALKVIPMLLALCSMLNILFDFLNIDSFILSFIGGMSLLPLLFLYIVASVFRFCIYHRMFLHYILVNNVLTYIDYFFGIPVSNKVFVCLGALLVCGAIKFYKRLSY